MTATTSTVTEILPACGVKVLQAVTPATADDTDTVTINLATYGCTNIHGILGFQEGTTGSVITTEAPTTAVTSSSLVITIGGSTDNKVRTFIIWAY